MSRKIYMIAALLALGLFIYSDAAMAAAGECSGGVCGTPRQSGGGCGCGCGAILINNTDEGDTYQYADDYDNDGVEDDFDNCPFNANKDRLDSDGDGVGDACDNCKLTINKTQLDTDGDMMGDECDTDIDNDGKLNAGDNCPLLANPTQLNSDPDAQGDACDTDDDNDGVLDIDDNCPLVANPMVNGAQPIVTGKLCDNDTDGDKIMDGKDKCPLVADDQKDTDGDGIGDACDNDDDNDKILDLQDNCPLKANFDQVDDDRDNKGNACDSRYCYTINGDEKNCLDPTSTFQVYSPETRVRTGEATRLRLFANRKNSPMTYKWVMDSRPEGSSAVVKHPVGAVRVSTPFEYHYLSNNVAEFTADEPGTYKLKVVADLVFADTVNPAYPTSSSTILTIVADGDSTGGCSMSSGNAGTFGFVISGLLLGLALVFRRRR